MPLFGLMLNGYALQADDVEGRKSFGGSEKQPVNVEAAGCSGALAARTYKPGNSFTDNAVRHLDSSNFRLMSWNIQKGKNLDLQTNMLDKIADSDLVLLQEASADMVFGSVDNVRYFKSFASGYRTRKRHSGLFTLSTTPPLTQCNLQHIEPWLGTPKATMITQYKTTKPNQTLVVANVHAINFTLGTRHFAEQFEHLAVVLRKHHGPIVLSGDLNTWSRRRQVIVSNFAEELGLKPVFFPVDQRSQFMGKPVDHIYLRGLNYSDALVTLSDVSDHNPVSVTFSL